jgi:hypothetical protein
MTADELEACQWLDDPQSREAGTGVGIESGRRIVGILRQNPEKKPDRYHEVRLRPALSPSEKSSVASTERSNRKTWPISAKWSNEKFVHLNPPAAVVLEFCLPIERRDSYNGRHLAQEDHLKETKTVKELEQAKEYHQASTFRSPSRIPFLRHALTLVSSPKNWAHVRIERQLTY